MRKSDILPKIKTIFPRVFWQPCNRCNEEYKKEPMWRVLIDGRYHYYCKHCFATEKEVLEYTKKRKEWLLTKLSSMKK